MNLQCDIKSLQIEFNKKIGGLLKESSNHVEFANKLKELYKSDYKDDLELFKTLFLSFSNSLLAKLPKNKQLIENLTDENNLVLTMQSESNLQPEDDLDTGEKEENLDSNEVVETDKNFINLYYKDSVLELEMQQQFKLGIFKFLISNGSKFIDNNRDLNIEISNYKEELLQNVLEYLKEYNSTLYNKYKNRTIFDPHTGFYTGVIEELKADLNKEFNTNYNINILNQNYRNKNNKLFSTKSWINMFNSMFILTHFDMLLKLNAKKAINIKEYLVNKNDYNLLEDNKYYIGDSSNLVSSWRDDSKDIDFSKEIGDINRIILNVVPRYDNGQLTEQFLSFDTVVSLIQQIYKSYNRSTNRNQIISYNDLINDVEKSKEFIDVCNKFGKSYVKEFMNGGKITLGALLAKVQESPNAGFPILFSVLLRYNDIFTNKLEDLNTVRSLYEFLFNPARTDSFLSLHNPLINQSYYNYICQMFDSISTIELREWYEKNPGQIEIRTLSDKSLDNDKWNLENNINGRLDYNSGYKFDSFTISENNLKNIDSNEEPNIILNINGYECRVTSTSIKYYLNGVELNDLSEDDVDHFRNLLSEIIGKDFTKNSIFDIAYQKLHPDYISHYKQLITLALNSIYNRELMIYAKNKDVKGIDIKSFIQGENRFYPEDAKITFDKSEYILHPVSSDYSNRLTQVGQVVSYMSGRFASGVVKDAEGKSINQTGLAMLTSNVRNQIELIEKQPDSASKHLAILKLFSGVQFARDMGLMGFSKTATKFSHAEMFTSLIYDYYGGDVPAFMTDILSDKSRLIRVLVNGGLKINGTSFNDMTYKDVLSLIRSDLYKFYKNIVDNRNAKFDRLSEYIQKRIGRIGKIIEGLEAPRLDYENNFEQFNQWLIDNNIDEELFFHSLMLDNPNEYIKNIIELSRKDGKWSINKLIDDQLERWGSEENTQRFFTQKEKQMVSDLLQKNISLLTALDGQDIQSTAIKNFKKLCGKNWVGSKGIKLATISYKAYDNNSNSYIDKSFDIYKKIDLLNNRIYKQLQKIDVFARCQYIAYQQDPNNLITKDQIDIESPTFNFDALCKLFQAYEYSLEVSNIVKKSPLNITDETISNINNFIQQLYESANLIDNIELRNYLISELNNLQAPNYDEILSYYESDENITSENAKELANTKYEAQLKRFAEQVYKLMLQSNPKLQNLQFDINPQLKLFNAKDYLIGREFQIITVGSHLNHPRTTEYQAWMDAVKRNVAETAAKHKFLLNSLQGLGSECTVAVIKDIYDDVFTVNGKRSSIASYDGGTFVNGITSYLENISLGDSKVGTVKKEFIHDKDGPSGSAVIIKTAGYPITNALIRSSHVYRRLNQRSLIKPFKKENGEICYPDISNVQSLIGHSFYNPSDKCIYRISNITYNSDTTHTINYEVYDQTGNRIQDSNKTLLLNNNYSIWNDVLGGQWSCSIEFDSDGRIKSHTLDESSFIKMVDVVNQVGYLKKGVTTPIDQTQFDQVCKRALVDFMVGEGSMKHGIANENTEKCLFEEVEENDSYELTTFKIHMYDSGVQLDAEHEADESVLSMMTQVVNALGARNYTGDKANEVYKALGSLARIELGNLLGNDSDLQTQIVNLIVKSIVNNVSSTDNKILQNIESDLKELLNNKKGEIELKDIKGKLPLSHPDAFKKIWSIVAANLTRKCIRIKFPGIMCVLNPSNQIILLYDGQTLDYYKGDEKNILTKKQSKVQPLKHATEIRLGTSYIINGTFEFNGKVYNTGDSIKIDSPDLYWAIKDSVNTKSITLTENLLVGRDLAAYNIIFTDLLGNKHCLWDLEDVHQLFALEDKLKDKTLSTIEKESIKQQIKIHKRSLQESLNALSSYNPKTTVKLRVNGQSVEVTVKEINEIQEYEVLMPQVYATQFGLKAGDSIKDISNNKEFFFNRMVANYMPNVTNTDLFDFEFKAINGKHTYVISNLLSFPEGLVQKNVKTIIEKGVRYVINNDGKKLYKIGMNDKVYTDGQNDIIYSEHPEFYIDNLEYQQFLISPRISKLQESSFDGLFEILNKSDKTKKLQEALIKTYEESNYTPNEQIAYNIRRGYLTETKLKELVRKIKKGEQLKGIAGHIVQNLYSESQKIHTSFLQSLKILAARIPAQSHQSFMAMKVAGFTNDAGKNNAFVNRYQLYLQGSDYDIDKVSLLGRKFSNGYLIKWSPYQQIYNIKVAEISENFPFPDGIETIIDENINDQQLIDNINHDKEIYDSLKGEEKLEYLVELFKEYNSYKQLPINAKWLVDILNKHNLYFTHRHDIKDALINFISTNMFNISRDTSNLIQGQISVDDPTGLIKGISSKSKLSIKTVKYDPGAITSKIEMLLLTLTGKENTGIVASSLKVFEAVSQAAYNIINEGTDKEKASLLINQEILGKNVQLMANLYDKYGKVDPNSELGQALLNVDNDVDAYILFSALLSLSTDNAKDPVLSKINADPEMIGLYISGVALGFDMEVLFNLMTSKSGFLIKELQQPNMFIKDPGMFNIKAVINYLKEGPKRTFRQFYFEFKAEIDSILSNVYNIEKPNYNSFLIVLNNPDNHFIDHLRDFYKQDLNKEQIAEYKEINNTIQNSDIITKLKDLIFNLSNSISVSQSQGIENQKRLTILENALKIFKDTEELTSDIQELYQTDNISEEFIKSEIKVWKKHVKTNKDNTKHLEEKFKIAEKLLNKLIKSKKLTKEEQLLKENIKINLSGKNSVQFGYGFSKSLLQTNPRLHGIFWKFLEEHSSWLFNRQVVYSEQMLINDEILYPFEELQKLNKFHEEMQSITLATKLNQQLPNSISEQISFIYKFEDILKKTYATYKKSHNSTPVALNNFKKLNEQIFGENDLRLDLNEFLNNEKYQQAAIDAFESIKFALNPLRIWIKNGQYLGYLYTANKLIQAGRIGSSKYNTLYKLGRLVFSQCGVSDSNAKIKMLNNLERFYDRIINNSFMQGVNNPINTTFRITGNYYIKEKDSIKLEEDSSDTVKTISLSTEAGRATFKYWMEHTVIPELKKKYTGSPIIRDLTPVVINNLDNKKTRINCYTLPINLSPRQGSFEETQLTQYQGALNSLRTLTYSDGLNVENVFNLLYYYNLIVYNNQSTQNSLTKLFNLIKNANIPIVDAHNALIAQYDLIEQIDPNKDFSIMDLISSVVSPSNLFDLKGNFGLVFDSMSGTYLLVEREPSKQHDFDEYAEDLEDFQQDFYPDLENEFEYEGETISDKLQKYGYQLFGETKTPKDVIINFENVGSMNRSRIILSEDIQIESEKDFENNSVKVIFNKNEYNLSQLVKIAKENEYDITEDDLIVKFISSTKEVVIDTKETEKRIKQCFENKCE